MKTMTKTKTMTTRMIVAAAALALGLGACSKSDAGGAGAAGKKVDPAAAKAKEEAKARPVETEGRRIDIMVTKLGYDPGKVTVAKGEKVTLVFTRTEPTECGAEIAIPSLNVKKPLPLNEPVAIAFSRDEPGEVGFACGMDMMRGIGRASCRERV